MSDIIDIVVQETIDVVDITVNPNIIEVNVTRTSGGGGIPTLQEVLDNNHDLVDGNFFAGNFAGVGNTNVDVIGIGLNSAGANEGSNINALGSNAGNGNIGNDLNALGAFAGLSNEGNNVNALGTFAGLNNIHNNVNLLGSNATADEDGQTVFSKDGTIMARISTTELTASRKYTLQDADGTLAFLSDVSGVPYTGATQDVNLGEFGLLTGNIEFDNTPTNIPTAAGSMVWNDTDGTVDLKLKGGNVTLQIGQENVLRVVNKTATNINLLEANYQAVRVTGAQGQRLKVDLAQATTDALSAETIGLVTETINNNQEGFITTSGLIRNVNTTGSLQSETWADGDILYLSPTTAGQLTKVKPTAPNHLVIVGYVVHAHATQGSIFVKVDNGYELNELHNVKITSETNNQLLAYTSATDIWENKNLIDILENFNRTQGIYFFEEFMGSQGGGVLTSFGGLVTTTSGTGANCITTNASFPIVNRTNQQGVVRAQTGTTLTGFAGYSYGNLSLFRGTGAITLETYTTIETLSTLAERFYMYFGYFGTGSSVSPNNGIFFLYDEGGLLGFGASTPSPNWKCVTINSFTRTFTITSIPVVAGQWYKLRININAASNSVEFYIDGTLVATHTTNIPALATAMTIGSYIIKTIGTTARGMQTDYFMYEEIFTNPR